MSRSERLGGIGVLVLIVASISQALCFTMLIAWYWSTNRLGGAGAGMALSLIVLPASSAGSAGLALSVAWFLRRRGALGRAASIVWGLSAAVALFACLFGLEVWRTREWRDAATGRVSTLYRAPGQSAARRYTDT
jgi:hypothetical protein